MKLLVSTIFVLQTIDKSLTCCTVTLFVPDGVEIELNFDFALRTEVFEISKLAILGHEIRKTFQALQMCSLSTKIFLHHLYLIIFLVWDRILRQEAATTFKILLTEYKLVGFPFSSTVLRESL